MGQCSVSLWGEIIGWKYVMGGRMNFIFCDDCQRDRKNFIELLKSYAKEKEQKNA